MNGWKICNAEKTWDFCILKKGSVESNCISNYWNVCDVRNMFLAQGFCCCFLLFCLYDWELSLYSRLWNQRVNTASSCYLHRNSIFKVQAGPVKPQLPYKIIKFLPILLPFWLSKAAYFSPQISHGSTPATRLSMQPCLTLHRVWYFILGESRLCVTKRKKAAAFTWVFSSTSFLLLWKSVSSSMINMEPLSRSWTQLYLGKSTYCFLFASHSFIFRLFLSNPAFSLPFKLIEVSPTVGGAWGARAKQIP